MRCLHCSNGNQSPEFLNPKLPEKEYCRVHGCTKGARLSHEVGVEGVDGHLQHQQPHNLGRGHLAEHRPKGDHCCAGREGAVDQQGEVQLDERPAKSVSGLEL